MTLSDTHCAARTYARAGWRVIPVHYLTSEGVCSCTRADVCANPAKHPKPKNWTGLATTDLTTVDRWWRECPPSNVGIATGGPLAVLDVDPRNGGDLTLKRLEREHGALPHTANVASGGGGWHFYFAAAEDIPSRDVGDGLELKAAGRQVVAPPSIHASGREYAWRATPPLAPLPAWLRQRPKRSPASSNLSRGIRFDVEDDALQAIPATLYVAALTGQEPGRDGKICCPFHADTAPSLHVYPGERGWVCFGCRRGGTIIDFGAALYGIEPRGRGFHEIRRRLRDDLGRAIA